MIFSAGICRRKRAPRVHVCLCILELLQGIAWLEGVAIIIAITIVIPVVVRIERDGARSGGVGARAAEKNNAGVRTIMICSSLEHESGLFVPCK